MPEAPVGHMSLIIGPPGGEQFTRKLMRRSLETSGSPAHALVYAGRKPGGGVAEAVMIRLTLDDVRCEILFASELQPSDALSADEVAEVLSRTVRRIGVAGCVSRMAQEFGDHPEAAAQRMRWVRRVCLAAGTAQRAA
jgi:hypothetical protein